MKLRIVLLLAISLLTAGLTVTGGAPATAAESPRGSEYFEAFFPSGDGTMLHAEYLLPSDGCADVVNPDGSTGCPTIVSMGPYFGSGVQDGPGSAIGAGYFGLTHQGVSSRFFDFAAYDFADGENIFDKGYAWVQVDSRGYGSSGGCNDYGGPGEQMDAAAAVEWAASQEWSNGKVGTWGKSYDAWTQVMALDEGPEHLEAAIIQAPIIDGYGIAYVNGIHHDYGWYATTGLYTLYDYSPNSLYSDPEEHTTSLSGSATDPCWAFQHAEVLNPDRNSEYWQARDIRPNASTNTDVAVFWVHGFTDVNTKPDQVFGVYDGLTEHNGDKTRAWFGQWDHKRGTDHRDEPDTMPSSDDTNDDRLVGRAGFHEEVLDWLEHYLRGADFTYEVNEFNLVEVQDNYGEWRTEATYPAPDVRMVDFPLNSGTYLDALDSTDRVDESSDGFWSVSEEATEPFRITGESVVTIDADISQPNANFIGVLYEITGTRAQEISRSMFRIEESGEHTFTTHPGDFYIEPGSRLGFRITSDHPESQPYPTGQEVTINGGTVSMPVPLYERDINLTGGPATSTSPYSTTIDRAEMEASVVEGFDIGAIGEQEYPDLATREAVQGPVDFTRPVE